MSRISRGVNNDLKEMTTKLLTYESKLIERDAEKKATKSEKSASKEDDKQGGSGPTCTYKPCGKPGHSEEECHVKKRSENANTNDSSNKNKNDEKSKPKSSEDRRHIAAVVIKIYIGNNKTSPISKASLKREME